MRELVTLIGHTLPDTGEFAYRAITPRGEYAVQDLGDHWGAVPLSDDDAETGVTFRSSTPEKAVRKALAN